MDKWIMCIVALILGMLTFHMLQNVCGCKTVEGFYPPGSWQINFCSPKLLVDRNQVRMLSKTDCENRYYQDPGTGNYYDAIWYYSEGQGSCRAGVKTPDGEISDRCNPNPANQS